MYKRHAHPGFSMVEMLAVMSIIIILLALSVAMFQRFTHTARIVAAADTVSKGLREARHYAMANNAQVMPMFLRDTDGRLTLVYGVRVAFYHGQFTSDWDTRSWAPGSGDTWTLDHTVNDASLLMSGAFVILAAPKVDENPDLKLDQAGAAGVARKRRDMTLAEYETNPTMPYNELVYLRVDPPNDPNQFSDTSKYTYRILARNLHNTERCQQSSYPGAGSARVLLEAYLVLTDAGVGDRLATMTPEEWREHTIDGIQLPEHIKVDQVPDMDDPLQSHKDIKVRFTCIAQDGIFRETNKFDKARRSHLKPYSTDDDTSKTPVFDHKTKTWYQPQKVVYHGTWEPEWRPVFLPDGSAVYRSLDYSGWLSRGGYDQGNARWYAGNSGFRDFTIRLTDRVTRECRYVTIRSSNGQVIHGESLPTGQNVPPEGRFGYADGYAAFREWNDDPYAEDPYGTSSGTSSGEPPPPPPPTDDPRSGGGGGGGDGGGNPNPPPTTSSGGTNSSGGSNSSGGTDDYGGSGDGAGDGLSL